MLGDEQQPSISDWYPRTFALARSEQWKEAMERSGRCSRSGSRPRGDAGIHRWHDHAEPDDVEVPGLAGRPQRQSAAPPAMRVPDR